LSSRRTDTEDGMDTLASYLASEHIKDLHREADAVRLARSAERERTRPAWRKRTGTAARRLSSALADVAAELDPVPRRASYGRE
jgi:hypothetical protein